MKTISPSNMLQQINRERKITHHYYFIYHKKVLHDTLLEEDEFKMIIQKDNALSLKLFDNSKYNKFFCKLLYLYEYKQNCYNSNKFLHLRELLEQRGFILTNRELKLGSRDKLLQIAKKDNVLHYIMNNYKLTDLLKSRVNESLFRIYDTTKIREFIEIMTDNFRIRQFINCKHLFMVEDHTLKIKLDQNHDFSIMKMTGDIKRVQFTRDILKRFDMYSNLQTNEFQDISEQTLKDIIKEYKSIFRDNTKNDIELKTMYDRIKFVGGKLYKKLDIPMKTKKVKKDGKVIVNYWLDTEITEMFVRMYKFTKRHYEKTDTLYIQFIENRDEKAKERAELQTSVCCDIRDLNDNRHLIKFVKRKKIQ